MENFEQIKKEGRLLYLCVRGSTCQRINTPTSDRDIGGIYIAKESDVFGLQCDTQVQDEKGDTVWYEIGKFMSLLLKANPTVLEYLFVDDEFVLYEHPLFTEIKKHRNEFLTKDCFSSFCGYAVSQIHKAKGLNKKINFEPMKEHLHPLDFCYTFKNQGSQQIVKWLEERGLKQRYCGLVNIPNSHDVYGLYYDFGNHMLNESDWIENNKFIDTAIDFYKSNWFVRHSKYWKIRYLLRHVKAIGYRGIVGETDDIHIENFEGKPKIFDLRLSSIEDKNIKPICHIVYNSSGYQSHCIKWKEYKEWETNRNPIRYESNLKKSYDSKNMGHCVRLMHMGIEIAQGKGMIVNREKGGDRDFILRIRNHGIEYDELIKYVDEQDIEMRKAMENSTLPQSIDYELVNNLLCELRKKFYSLKNS